MIDIAVGLLMLVYQTLTDKAGMVSVPLILRFLFKLSAVDVLLQIKNIMSLMLSTPFKMTVHSPAEFAI